MKDIGINIRLSLQIALLGHISSHVRAICCDWSDDLSFCKIYYYLDIDPNDEERELQSIALTEFGSDMQMFNQITGECIFSLKPFEELNKYKLVIFWRNETAVF